jgi:hypothetical protein
MHKGFKCSSLVVLVLVWYLPITESGVFRVCFFCILQNWFKVIFGIIWSKFEAIFCIAQSWFLACGLLSCSRAVSMLQLVRSGISSAPGFWYVSVCSSCVISVLFSTLFFGMQVVQFNLHILLSVLPDCLYMASAGFHYRWLHFSWLV